MSSHFVTFPYIVRHLDSDPRRMRDGLVFPLRRRERPLAEVIPLPVRAGPEELSQAS